MRISDWSSDVCSSDLPYLQGFGFNIYAAHIRNYWTNSDNGLGEVSAIFANMLGTEDRLRTANPATNIKLTTEAMNHPRSEERRVGKECVVRVDHGGRRTIKKKTN